MKRAGLPLAALVAVTAALGMSLVYAPTEAVQGHVQRIFYVHVPSAWVGYLAFVVVALSSVLVLVRGERRWDRVAVSSAEIGVVFTTVMLATGSIWASRAWGTWWVWDPRITSTLVLWLVYVGYLLLRSAIADPRRRARVSAVVGIVGALDIPVVHFAVTWWRGQHPEATVITPDGPQLPGSMLLTLLVAVLAFTLVYAALLAARIRIERDRDRVATLERDRRSSRRRTQAPHHV